MKTARVTVLPSFTASADWHKILTSPTRVAKTQKIKCKMTTIIYIEEKCI